MKEHIKWIAIQPLTGGMYLGAEEAIGYPAEFILSFKGNNYGELKEDLSYKICENELYLQRYLEKHDKNPIRYDIQEGMFDPKLLETLKPTICVDGCEVDLTEQYKDLDIVVAVPVCSGLSTITNSNQETRDSRNCNMKFITEYVIKVIQPKIYVFENAPTLMGTRGKGLVEHFKQLAKDNGYSVLFYRTDTNLHFNCQRRQRTFVIFFKHTSNNENEEPFVWEYCNNKISVKDFFANIKSKESDYIEMSRYNQMMLDYTKKIYGDNWREKTNGSPIYHFLCKDNFEGLIEYFKSFENTEKMIKYLNHIIDKVSSGKGFYSSDIFIPREDHFPSVQFRSIPSMLHPTEDRLCSTREYLSLMGHPEDFEWLTGNDPRFLGKIGQNVPVKTAKFIVEQCIKCLEKWDEPRGTEFNCAYQDNIKQRKVW